MKRTTLISALMVFIALATANVAPAQVLPGPTNFPMVGIARGQTLLLNLVAFPPTPCMATLGFQDSNGNPVGNTQTVSLAAGQSTVLAVNANSLTTAFGQRVELLPIVTGPDGALTAPACVATAEVINNVSRVSTVLVPGAVQLVPQPVPDFGMLGVTLLQTVRLNVVAFPPTPCIGQLSFADKNGNLVGTPLNVQLLPGQATFLDLPGNALVSALGVRAAVRPVVTVTEGAACVASTEVFGNITGATAVYQPQPEPD